MRRTLFGTLAAALLVVGVACSSDSGEWKAATPELLGAAVAHRVLVDNSFGGSDVFRKVLVVERVGRDDDGSFMIDDDDRTLTSEERRAIEVALVPRAVEFVPVNIAVDEDAPESEALIFVAQPSGSDDEATVTTGLVCGGLCGAGGATRFQLVDGEWRFVENVGARWVS